MSIQENSGVKRNRLFPRCIGVLSLAASQSALALSISLTGINGFSEVSDPDAWNGFLEAASRFESAFDDPVTVNLDVGFEVLGGTTLGSTSITTAGVLLYSDVKTGLTADANSADDLTAVANLPVGPSLSFLTNDPTTTIPTTQIIDNNGSGNNIVLEVSKANAKALGLTGPDATADAQISFNSSFGFDFNPGNGITSGLFDFVGAATHEIGHALGFVSGVDIVDATSGAGPSAPFDLDPFRVFSVWDLYRFSAESLSAGVDFDFSTGGSPFFSIDGGATSLGTFSTGRYNGDGRTASHWKDSLGLGLMDPTLASSELGVLTALDFAAFDVMGWDLAAVPVPAAVWLFGSGLMGLAALGRRRSNPRISS